MKIRSYALGFLLTILLVSCKQTTEKSNAEDPEISREETSKENLKESSTIDQQSIIQDLQGKWKESEFPFRLVEFQDTLAKFTEEGMMEEPRFQKFQVSAECLFQVNNMKNVGGNDTILVLVEARRCEKLKVTDTTLTLSGYSTNTKSEYHIVYKKVE